MLRAERDYSAPVQQPFLHHRDRDPPIDMHNYDRNIESRRPLIRPVARSTPFPSRTYTNNDQNLRVHYFLHEQGNYQSSPPPTRRERYTANRHFNSQDSSVEQIRKWNVTYDGSRNLLEFLEQVEELSATYGIPDDELVPCVPMLLRDKAIHWYRNNQRTWRTWNEFKDDIRHFFLPVDIERQLEEDIRNRTQGPNESARDFVTSLQTLVRRYGKMSYHSELDRIYNNLRPEYRKYIRRREISSVNELIRLVNEFEMMLVQEKAYKPPPSSLVETDNRKHKEPRNQSLAAIENKINNPYSRSECCWRCGQRDHMRNNCKNPPKLFCSWCGLRDIMTFNCKCPESENYRRAGAVVRNYPRPTNTRNPTRNRGTPNVQNMSPFPPNQQQSNEEMAGSTNPFE